MKRIKDQLNQFWSTRREKRLYEKAAKKNSEAVSAWIRRELENAAKRQNNGTTEKPHHD